MKSIEETKKWLLENRVSGITYRDFPSDSSYGK